MRVAELVMAIVMAVFSLAIMWKSAELPIGWIPKSGPGGGAFPFWLGAGMLVCCGWIILRWFRRTSPPSQSRYPYMDRHSLNLFAIGAGSLTAMVVLIHLVGVYVAVAAFLIFYLGWVGHHRWPVTLSIALITPVFIFFFFEVALRIELPKGWIASGDDSLINEWIYYPLYDMFL